jgi:hypothetical protein
VLYLWHLLQEIDRLDEAQQLHEKALSDGNDTAPINLAANPQARAIPHGRNQQLSTG